MAEEEGYSYGWQRPQEILKMRKMKTKKRALQSRFCFEGESPSKKSKHGRSSEKTSSLKAKPPPPCEETCDTHDSTLMDLLNITKDPSTSTPVTNGRDTDYTFADAFSPASMSSMNMSPQKHQFVNTRNNLSPLRTYLPSYCNVQETPLNLQKRRQPLRPAPAPPSPSSWSNSSRGSMRDQSTPPKIRRIKGLTATDKEAQSMPTKHNELCLDWSLKQRLLITTSKPFGWSSNNLKTSEESSGISAFVRCIDMQPGDPRNNSQLDTSLGAQFHQCCLYWQHPYLPTMNLFPREGMSISSALSTQSPYSHIRFEEKVFDCMHSEWIEAFRSAFQLLRTRQCPFFYICANQFTCLFCAAGTQGNDQIQIYVTPSTKGFRDALKAEGIDFILPYCKPVPEESNGDIKGKLDDDCDHISDKEDSDEEPDKWLNEMGISQDLSVSMLTKITPADLVEEKNKSSLVIIAGKDSLSFFNFLINSKTFLVTTSGPFAGMPPTILGPVAFHGATLRSLKVNQCKAKGEKNNTIHSIEMNGPILPHVMHMLCALLSKTVENYKINIKTLASTTTLNLNANTSNFSEKKANVFEMQNLSDCGLKKLILEVFCRSDNCDTIKDNLTYENSLFEWS